LNSQEVNHLNIINTKDFRSYRNSNVP